ncbi:hypothetical protein LAZ67_1001085 [Cordylochernes scorpioides]|uniref:Uncharacterized protein n=1 Tax=Cordylochernes scorpioides TaxID=51811 RepID=A0ABY6JWP9_9ARAC|nr:hypothetical protein LAZ67_1001085 [Cordylochernes scorpioides]
MKSLRCLHTSLSEQRQCPLSWMCKAAALGLCQFSARLRPLLDRKICTGSTTQWQADLAPKEMTASDMRNRRHVQPLLTWSTNAAHPVSLD